MKLLQLTTILLLALGLHACSNSLFSGRSDFAQTPEVAHLDSADEYLQLAASTLSPEKEAYEIKAVKRLLQDGMVARANQILRNIDRSELDDEAKGQYQLLESKIALLQNHPRSALNNLNQISYSTHMPRNEQIEYHRLLAAAYQRSGYSIESIRELITLDRLLSDEWSRQQNQRKIWDSLEQLSTEQLHNAILLSPSMEMQGWLELAQIANRYEHAPQQLLTAIDGWRQNFPRHPGNQLLPSAQHAADTQLSSTPQQIALLLPLNGPLAGPGQAVRSGFMAAYFKAKQQHRDLPTIRIYDTTKSSNIVNLYLHAQREGAELIVGPLDKRKVNELANSSALSKPTLTLNYLNDAHNPSPFIYQFGLSPVDEAKSAAEKAWQDHHRNVILISPKGKWGQKIAGSFRERWQSLGGHVIDELNYGPKENLNKSLKKLLNVDESYQRNKKIKRLVGGNIKFTPRRRQDADMVFLVATPKRAKQIRPLLKFYYAGNLPVYATSQVFSLPRNSSANRDLEGVIFCDMPWVFNAKQQIIAKHSQLSAAWPEQLNHYTRLYALGMDAFTLTTQLHRLSLFPDFGITAKTGILYLEAEHRITRNLTWAQIRKGRAVTLKDV